MILPDSSQICFTSAYFVVYSLYNHAQIMPFDHETFFFPFQFYDFFHLTIVKKEKDVYEK